MCGAEDELGPQRKILQLTDSRHRMRIVRPVDDECSENVVYRL